MLYIILLLYTRECNLSLIIAYLYKERMMILQINNISKFRKFLILIIITGLVINIFSGCTNNQENPIENSENNGEDIEQNEVYEEIEINEAEVVEYSLGEGIINQRSGQDMPYDMVGAIGVPKEGNNHPIIFILHGSHYFIDYNKKRYDLGFKYLVDALAKRGFLTLSINVNANYALEYGEPFQYERLISIYNDHLEKLTAAIDGNYVGFGIDLTNKGDLSTIGLVGHSRSGAALNDVFNAKNTTEKDNIFALLKVAPSIVFLRDEPNPDIPTGIILPQYDGDVRQLDGQDTFEEIQKDEAHNAWASLIYLKGANHNFFNDNVKNDDRKDNYTDEEKNRFLNREQQKDFLIHYSADFFYKALGKNIKADLFDIEIPTESTAYDLSIKSSFITGDMKSILKTTVRKKLEKNDLGGENISQNVIAKYLIESYIPINDQLPAFTHAGSPEELGLLSINWEDTNAQFELKIPESEKNINAYKAITLYMALDPGSQLNKPSENQSFTVIMKDRDGNKSSVLLDNNTPALAWPEGEFIKDEYKEGEFVTYWSIPTPLSHARIPLNQFENVDFKNIDSIILKFDQKESGSILLRDIMILR